MTEEHLKHVCIALVNHRVPATHAIILHLTQNGPVKMSQICEIAGFSRSNATGLVDTMCTAELATREEDPDDRRSVLVRATDAGIQTLQSIKKQIEHL